MDVDEMVVDLSVRSSVSVSSNAPEPSQVNLLSRSNFSSQMGYNNRRVLRPRTEPRSYVESPDVLINGTLDGPRTNGNLDYSGSDTSDGEMPPIMPVKELSFIERKQRDRGLRRLREELRSEEMKLVLLKKLKQSQQLKENVAVLPPNIPPSALPPTGLPSGLSITPTTVRPSSAKNPTPLNLQAKHTNSYNKPVNTHVRSSNMHPPSLSVSPMSSRSGNLSVPQPPQRSSLGRPPSGLPPGVKDLSPSVTITPAPPQPLKTSNSDIRGVGTQQLSHAVTQDRIRAEDSQTPAQRQAAAKLALRKQLEKTLLQIPPPKPPPPEMHFIPNPSNTEFIYLVGLEHVVDFLTKDTKIPINPIPFCCSQCHSDFTPVWKWESKDKTSGAKVICEQCVTNNVKKALKAEHTNRLKTAFVKALQQEQEIEQRLAQNGLFSTNSPTPPMTSEMTIPKSVTPTPISRHVATPPAPPSAQQTPPPLPPPTQQQQQQSQQTHHQSRGSHSSSNSEKFSQNAAAMQALQQQILRSLAAGAPPAHMLHLTPLLYQYQFAMAQAVANNSNNKNSTPNLADLQRAADLHRQYLLDMIPPGPGQRHNWK